MTNFLYRLIVIFSLLAGVVNPVQAQPPAPATGIRILVHGIHYGGNIVYNYKVINNGDTPFNNFTIGGYFDIEEDYQFPQLTRLPLGWKYGRVGETGREIILDPASINQPPYWTAQVFGQQEASNYYLEWHAFPGTGGVPNVIRSGQTLAGFSVTIPLEDSKLSLPMVTGQPLFTGPDEKYIRGGFMVGLVSGKDVWGALEREDTTPPVLTVTATPAVLWPPNNKMVDIAINVTVKDDYDPQPEIKIESITSNEGIAFTDYEGATPGDDRQFRLRASRAGNNMAGRIYTVTYSATDGSGNKSTASTTVTVPHDQGK